MEGVLPAANSTRLAILVIVATGLMQPGMAGASERRSLAVKGGGSAEMAIDSLARNEQYGVLVSASSLATFGETDRLEVIVEDAAGLVVWKRLHQGDPDLYLTLQPRRDGKGRIRIDAKGAQGKTFKLNCSVERMHLSGRHEVTIGAAAGSIWRTAQPIELGKTVFASNDERPYIPAADGTESVFADMLEGGQWYTFTYDGEAPKLVHFMIELLDREIPVDVRVFTHQDDKDELKPYEEGLERYITEQSTPFHGLNKLTARVIKKGTYYVRVMGNHPAYQLRTNVYDVPPYLKMGVSREEAARKAIRVAMDYLVNRGDSWHADTPRNGGIVLRTTNALQETQLCIACHPTHFTTRGEMVAVENGWPIRQRSAVKFLTERLYNNPRPLYGDPEAAWVRVISAPGNVTSRLAYMEMEFEKYITGEQRQGIMDDMGTLLAQYWSGMTETIDESNGNLPRVSGFEIATHSRYVFDEMYRRTHKKEYLELRDRAEKVALSSEPIDMLDLCWQAVALASADPERYKKEIHDLVERIFSYQKTDGKWSMVFGKKIVGFDYYKKQHTETNAPLDEDGTPKASEFQTYHCLYALAKCGVTTEDPRLAKALDWCLSRQRPNGAWQGNADFKNFDTTFRETQFGVMALSQLYKGPGSKGWNAGFPPPPKELSTKTVDGFLAAADQYWENPGPHVLKQVRAGLSHPQPLVREAAAACLGRLADAESLPALMPLLGDSSKMVQRSAAFAVREIATRRNTGHDLILKALRAKDDRTRWGAARIFGQHFRYLASDEALLDAMIELMEHDPAPAIRMAAAQALPKWWFWLKAREPQERIERALLAGLARSENPWVRRNLIEGLRNVLDDNTRYLYNTWIPALKRPEDQKRVEEGHQRVVMQQAANLGEALTHDNELQRDGVLRCFYTFHLEEQGGNTSGLDKVTLPETYLHPEPASRGENKWLDGYKAAAAYNPLQMGMGSAARMGNDSEPPEFKGEAATTICRALVAVLEANPKSGPAVIKTVKHLKTLPLDDALSAALLRLALHASGDEAHDMRKLLGDLLTARMSDGEAVHGPMAELISEGKGEALGVAGGILSSPARAKLASANQVSLALAHRVSSTSGDDPDLPLLVEAATQMTAVQKDPHFMEKVFSAAESGSSQRSERVLGMMLRSSSFLASGEPRKRFERMVRQAGPEQMKTMLKVAAGLDYSAKEADLSTSLALGIITTGLQHDDDQVRAAALDAVRSITEIQKNPAVVAHVRELSSGEGASSAASARTLLASMDARNGSKMKDPAALLDFDYFVKNVQPILQARGEDKLACVNCHANHSIFKLNEPSIDGHLTDQQLRENYRNALKVVDLSKPENSLILKKPTSPFDGIGVPGSYTRTHGGDVRWAKGKQTEEYRVILKWLQGARVSTSQPAGARAEAN